MEYAGFLKWSYGIEEKEDGNERFLHSKEITNKYSSKRTKENSSLIHFVTKALVNILRVLRIYDEVSTDDSFLSFFKKTHTIWVCPKASALAIITSKKKEEKEDSRDEMKSGKR